MSKPFTKLSTTTADNAAAAVTLAKPANGAKHKVCEVSASFSAAAIKLLTITDGGTVKGNYHVHNQRSVMFDPPLELLDSASISLAASGTGGVIGALTVSFFTL